MNFELQVKLLQHKNYLDFGLNFTKYLIGGLVLFGWMTQDVKATLWLSGVYVVVCYWIGWGFYRYGWADAGAEVGNRFNPFVKELRKKFK